MSWKRVGTVGVDSATLLIGDPCYSAKPSHPIHNWKAFCDWSEKQECPLAAELDADRKPSGVLGIAVSTGYGDGLYPVYVRVVTDSWAHRRVAEVRIVFIADEEASS